MEYFQAVHDALSASPFQVGVYGSGLTRRLVRDTGFANFTWLSQSTGFREYRAFLPQTDVIQAAPSRDLAKKLNFDDDVARSTAFGAFQLPPGSSPIGSSFPLPDGHLTGQTLMSEQAEKQFLRPWAERALAGGVRMLSPIRTALARRLAKEGARYAAS